ncbi:hypothetical protein BDV28DRAFT_140069 [Aspergillus coremiiformis]|uniref:Uncharacterized protein n=1 Tax=Aspergillus coremiiformis TaxID=138285 RepID=A0A5N6YXU0_9EURO|nr:hypothetical protein BDV28DRAFT_140069 [Aspergillus coremiiformis]
MFRKTVCLVSTVSCQSSATCFLLEQSVLRWVQVIPWKGFDYQGPSSSRDVFLNTPCSLARSRSVARTPAYKHVALTSKMPREQRNFATPREWS